MSSSTGSLVVSYTLGVSGEIGDRLIALGQTGSRAAR